MRPIEAKEWFKTLRAETGELAAFECVCDVALTVCSPSEHVMAARMAQKVDGAETEDILGLMALIGWELCENS
jgi:hypothetical protein